MRPTEPIEGVILAAGRGTRMSPFSERYPKPLLPILNKPLIEHQIEYLRSLGVRKVFVVIGHLGHEIALALRRGEGLGVQIEYVEQRDSLGIAHALMQLESRVSRTCVLLLGDIYFEVDGSVNPVEWMLERDAAGFLAVMEENDPRSIARNFAVHLDGDGIVRRVIEKPRFPQTHLKGCGIYVFDPRFFDAVRRTPRTAGRNEYELTDAIQTYIDDGARVVARVMMRCDINLTYPYDLLLANLRAVRELGGENVVAPDAEIHPEAMLDECVIGPGAQLRTPILLRRSVVFPETVVTTSEWVDRAVVTPDALVDCRYWVSASENAPVLAVHGR